MRQNTDWDDDGISPGGPKRPLEYVAPMLRLMAVGESRIISKAPERRIQAIAKRIGLKIRLEPLGEHKGLRLTLVEKPTPISPSQT